jgi:2-methylisocitrate lyase-like PEP mutase family enzyme
VASATDLPVSADLGNAFGDRPRVVAESFQMVAAAGALGASVEDATGREDQPIYDVSLAADRVRAAVEAVRGLAFPFTVTARCENYLVGREDIRETVARLQAYQAAGADVLYAPGIVKVENIRAVVSSVDRPVNLLMGTGGVKLTLADASGLGVKRVSVGSALCRAAYGAMLRAGREMKDKGTFEFAGEAISFQDISAIFPK